MGMFDYIHYNGKTYQTKGTPAQFLAEYEIRGDELWYKMVESKWVNDEDTLFGGYLEEISHEWLPVHDFDGSLTLRGEDEDYVALFWEGRLIRIKQIDQW